MTLSDTNFKNANTIVTPDDKGNASGATKKADYSPSGLLNRIQGYFVNKESTIFKETVVCCGKIKCSFVGRFFLEAGNIEWSEFVKASIFAKVLVLIKAPVYIFFTVSIPVVDLDLPMNGWHRSLTLLQCLIAPQIFFLLTGCE